MSQQPRRTRLLVLSLALLQLAAPCLSAIADGILSREASAVPFTHIEASTRPSCPAVHSPDCGVCRYLSLSATLGRSAPVLPRIQVADGGGMQPFTGAATRVTLALSRGRAPPIA